MPVITIQGIPRDACSDAQLIQLIEAIQGAASGIGALKITREDVTVFMPADLVRQGLGEELIIQVTGLVPKRERTAKVKERLLMAIRAELAEFAEQHIHACKKIEVFLLTYELEAHVGLIRPPAD